MDHRELAIRLFNQTWELLDQEDRSEEAKAKIIHLAHTSLYHWMQVGTPLEFQRGEWMVSHVYALFHMKESALFHANRCMFLTKEHQLQDFDLTFAYEALARAYALQNKDEAKKYLQLAYESLSQINEEEDRKYAKSQLDEIL
ncbi:MAG: hypothetical protein PHP32_01690 [Candidatus Izemoplasmatales bacterium]|nr:hypothetical protein [Candidatus Izemoplasmatales bacterium]